MKNISVAHAFFLIMLTSGCSSTKLDAIPVTDSEFGEPLSNIRKNHSDVPLYESYWPPRFQSAPNVVELQEKWGQPHRKETLWGEYALGQAVSIAIAAAGNWPLGLFVGLEAIFGLPQETYHWDKGDVHIDARVSRVGTFGYEPKLVHWQWTSDTGEAEENEVIADKSIQR